MGQNLVPNPSFEIYTTCPFSLNGMGPLPATPWTAGTMGSPDYFHECNNEENGGSGVVGVPSNDFGYQFAHSGVAYAGFLALLGMEYKEYPMVMLDQPLIAGNTYYVSFYVSLADNSCGLEKIGAYLSVDPPVITDTWSIYANPQVEANIGFLSDTMEWTLIEGCFTADGGERYMTFGNFYSYAESPIDPDCQTQTYAYYYIDDVTLVEETTMNDVLDLGPAVVACDSHTIVSNITGGSLIWSTGETSTSITVHTSGTYSLTVSGSCDPDGTQIDFVNVTLLTDQDTVNIEEDVVTFCDGEEYIISLDPTAGMYTWSDGSNGSEIVLTTPGIFQVTLDNGCDLSTDEVEVVVLYPPPIPDLGADTIICPGQEIVFAFDPDAGDYVWQDGSQSSTYSITDAGNYSLTITNNCGSVEDDLNVMLVIPPEVELGNSPTNLCLGDTIHISLDPLMGEYLWSDGSDESNYEITDGGFYGVTVTNFCGESIDGLMVSVIPPPTFDLPDEIIVCPAELPVLLAVQNPVNATEFNWNNDSQNPTTLADTAGTYSVVVSNECFSLTEEIIVTLEDNIPTVMLPPDQDLCPGDSVLLTADTIGTHMWQDGSTTDSLWVTSSGTYSLTTTSVCGMASDTVVFTYAPLLNPPNLGNDVNLCPGDEIVLYSGATTGDIVWQDGSTADSLVVTSEGTYHVTVLNQCAAYSDTVIVSFNSNPPALNLADAFTLCQGQSLTLDAGIADVEYLWSDGSTQSTLEVTQPGMYSLTISNGCGADQDTAIVSDGGPAPFVELGNDTSLCEGETFLLTPGFSDVDQWLWQDGSSLPSFEINSPGQITVQVSNTCGVSFDTLNVNLLPGIPDLNLGADTSLCVGESVLLTISIPDVDILWSDGSTGNNFLTSGEGFYFASITNACGVSHDTMEVTFVPDIPPLNLGPDQSLCPGETVTIDPGISNVEYLWHDGSTLATYSTTQQETIILTITNACGAISDTLEVIENNQGPLVDLGPDILACEGEIITIPSGISGVDYLWQDGSTTSSFTTSVSGEFNLQVSNACGTDTDTIQVMFTDAPQPFNLGADTILCPGESVTLLAPLTSNEILWQDSSDQLTMIADQPQTYWLQISNACGLTSDSIIISFDDNSPVLHLATSISWCEGDIITLDATQPFAANYQWSNGAITPTIEVVQPDLYEVMVSTLCQTASTQVDVFAGDDCITQDVKADIFIPNVFSPNQDGVNDVFAVFLGPDLNVVSMQGNMYDRWGNLVFSSEENPFTWDGWYADQEAQSGVYVYVITLVTQTLQGEKQLQLSGDVTLLR